MKKYERQCPSCKNTLSYSSYHALWLANKNKSSCRVCSSIEINNRPEIKKAFVQRFSNNKGFKNGFWNCCHSEDSKRKIAIANTNHKVSNKTKEKLSEINSGSNNPMFGKSFYDIWISKYGIDEANKRLQAYSQKQSVNTSGSNNPMFGKPSPQGSGNGWSGWYKGWFFRSLKELSYMINVIEKEGLKWESAECKKYAIPYKDSQGNNRTYYADFVINNKIIEIKPKQLISSKAIQIKVEAAKQFTRSIGFEYEILEPKTLSDKQIMDLHKSKSLIFTKRYEEKYMQKFGANL